MLSYSPVKDVERADHLEWPTSHNQKPEKPGQPVNTGREPKSSQAISVAVRQNVGSFLGSSFHPALLGECETVIAALSPFGAQSQTVGIGRVISSPGKQNDGSTNLVSRS